MIMVPISKQWQCRSCYYKFWQARKVPCPNCQSGDVIEYYGNRLKILKISREEILNTIFYRPELQYVRTTINVPTNAEIREVSYDMTTRCFDILLEHPSFPPIPEGGMPPILMRERKDYKVKLIE